MGPRYWCRHQLKPQKAGEEQLGRLCVHVCMCILTCTPRPYGFCADAGYLCLETRPDVYAQSPDGPTFSLSVRDINHILCRLAFFSCAYYAFLHPFIKQVICHVGEIICKCKIPRTPSCFFFPIQRLYISLHQMRKKNLFHFRVYWLLWFSVN